MHQTIEPAILYFGTPVVLVSTLNKDGSANLAPISSVFWLGWRCMLGLAAFSKTTQNLLRTGECVLNLPSVDNVAAVNRLALTTGSSPVPDFKRQKGYVFVADKFSHAGLTPVSAETIAVPRVAECPVQLEAVVAGTHRLAEDDARQRGFLVCIEVRIQRVHADDTILLHDETNRIDPDKWRPLMMSFQHFYGLGERLLSSRLATIPETSYRTPDIERARETENIHVGL
jgi:flavin reductase (DIM6/NTAB) family NADH-FMN oxidoreductase RutF